jgi:hypothetical protein
MLHKVGDCQLASGDCTTEDRPRKLGQRERMLYKLSFESHTRGIFDLTSTIGGCTTTSYDYGVGMTSRDIAMTLYFI